MKLAEGFWRALLIHAVVVVLVGLCLNPPQPSRKIKKFSVQIVEMPPVGGHHGSKFSTAKALSSRTHARLPLSALGIPMDYGQSVVHRNGQTSAGGVDDQQENRHLGLDRSIYEAIDRQVTYPMELADRKIEGSVQAKLWFTENGEFLQSKAEFAAASNYLKVIVARAVKRGLTDRNFKMAIETKGPFFVYCGFLFEITECEDSELIASTKMQLGQRLAFYRSHQRSVLQWDLGPLHGLGPIPSLDVLWFARKTRELISNNAKIDPLEKYRDDPEW